MICRNPNRSHNDLCQQPYSSNDQSATLGHPTTCLPRPSLLGLLLLASLVAFGAPAQAALTFSGFTVSGNQIQTTLCNTGDTPVLAGIATYALTQPITHPLPPTHADLDTQVLFDFQQMTLAPHTCALFTSQIPPCGFQTDAFQADAFGGGVITNFPGSDYYAGRLLFGKIFNLDNICPSMMGRMTGGGSVFTSDGTRVTHGFELHCSTSQTPNNLEVNFNGNQFHLDSLTSVDCAFDASTNTFIIFGTGTGTYNGVPGATVFFRLTDAGEPGTNDFARITIWDSSNTLVLDVANTLNNGNQQFHSS